MEGARTGPILRIFVIIYTPMASAEARAYNGGLRAEHPAGAQRVEPPVKARGLKLTEVFVFKALTFNASTIVLHAMTYCLSCFLFAHVFGFTNLFSSHCRTASQYHPTSTWVVLPSQHKITEDSVIPFMLCS